MRLRKIGAVLAGAAMLGATLAGAVTAGDQPAHSFWINDDGTPAAMIVVGDSAAASDVVSASLIAAKIGSMAVKTEEMKAPANVYWDKATDIPLAYSIPSWEMTIPWFAYNIPGGPAEGYAQFYKPWGITTMWTPNNGGYIPLVYNDVRINYSIGGLWFYDEDSRTWYFTHPDGTFSPWETHEEIQLRFDDLYLVGGKEYQLSGYPFQDHNADLAGGDIVPQTYPIDTTPSPPYMTADIPGLIYRIDNIRRPVQEEDAGYSLYFKWDEGEYARMVDDEWSSSSPWVDTQQLASSYYYTPDFQSIQRQRIPRIFVFGKEYKVVDATFLWSRDSRYRTVDSDWTLGGKYGYVIITGEPAYYMEQYIYKDSPVNLDGFEINVKDVDVDHNKVYIGFTDPAGDTQDFWMVLDPMHGFSATPQLMSQTGEATEYNGMSMWDVYFWGNGIQWRDNAGHAHYQYDYPTFMLDGIMTFVGAGGTIGAMFNAYTLSDVIEWKSQLCCIPFVEEPNNYSLWIDQQSTYDPCIGSYFSPALVGTDLVNTGPLGEALPLAGGLKGAYAGPIWSIDGHCIPYLGTEPPLDPRTDQFGDEYTYTHFIESVPDRYMDRDPNDYIWHYEDGYRARKQSHFNPDWWNCWTAEGCPIDELFTPGGDYPLDGADYMWEMNFALCDVIESVKCTTKWVIQGPNNYFRIEMEDISWDDNGNGWPYLQTNRVWAADGADDGIDYKVIMEVSSGTYKQTTSVPLDPTSIVKLDVEVTDDDMGAYNLVLVGGPVANILVKKLVDMGKTPDDGSAADWAVTSPGDYKLYTNGFDLGKDILVVAGANREETRKAAEELVASMG